MQEKLSAVEDRFSEIEHELARAGADHQRVTELAQERAELEPIVSAFRRYRSLGEELDEARLLLDGEDQGIRDLAQAEVARLEPALQELEDELRSMLLPRDPRDSRNVIVEIRAGTGGEEAALFAADLFRMYARYAEAHSWKSEVLSQHETGIGGFKEIIFEVKGKGAYSRLKYESASTGFSVSRQRSHKGAFIPRRRPWLCWPRPTKSKWISRRRTFGWTCIALPGRAVRTSRRMQRPFA